MYAYVDIAARAYLVNDETQQMRCVTSPRERFRSEDWEPCGTMGVIDKARYKAFMDDGWGKRAAWAAVTRVWRPGDALDQDEAIQFDGARMFTR